MVHCCMLGSLLILACQLQTGSDRTHPHCLVDIPCGHKTLCPLDAPSTSWSLIILFALLWCMITKLTNSPTWQLRLASIQRSASIQINTCWNFVAWFFPKWGPSFLCSSFYFCPNFAKMVTGCPTSTLRPW